MGKGSSNAAVAQLFGRLSCFLGCYDVAAAVVHRSATCVVADAVEVTASKPVAIKRMRHRDQFERELRMRYGGGRDVSACIIGVDAWHVPATQRADFVFEGRQPEPAPTDLVGDVEYPYVAVMPRGERSLFHAMASERIAGINVAAVAHLMRRMVLRVQQLHAQGLAHGNLKPRNLLRVASDEFGALGDVMICDMDAAVPLGSPRPLDLKTSTGYCPPELQVRLCAGGGAAWLPELIVCPSFDVWGIGVILFELATGRTLFTQDIASDNLVDAAGRTKLCVWRYVSAAQLQSVFADAEDCSEQRREDAKHLLAWILRGDPRSSGPASSRCWRAASSARTAPRPRWPCRCCTTTPSSATRRRRRRARWARSTTRSRCSASTAGAT